MTTISSNKNQHRFDTVIKPVFTIADNGSFPKLFLRDYLYEEISTTTGQFEWRNVPNQTDFPLIVEVRDTYLSSWTLSSGITNAANNFSKSDPNGYSGARATDIAAGNCSVEAKPANILGYTGIALQSGTFTYEILGAGVEHAINFLQFGTGVITEYGVIKTYFIWEIGDTGLIELYNGIVRYYQIKADGKKILLRTKRSLLVYPVMPTLMLFHTFTVLNSVRVWEGSGATTGFELYGVLDDFQDWQNPASFESLAEKTMNKDKTEDFTYFTDLKNIMTQSINISWEDGEKYQEFLTFWKWHDLSKPFIFKDNARHIEYFAKFVSAFKDNPLGGEIFGMSADIRQAVKPPLLGSNA